MTLRNYQTQALRTTTLREGGGGADTLAVTASLGTPSVGMARYAIRLAPALSIRHARLGLGRERRDDRVHHRQDDRDFRHRAQCLQHRPPRVGAWRARRYDRRFEQSRLRQASESHPHHRLVRRDLQLARHDLGKLGNGRSAIAVLPDEGRGAVQTMSPVPLQVVHQDFVQESLDDQVVLSCSRHAVSLTCHHDLARTCSRSLGLCSAGDRRPKPRTHAGPRCIHRVHQMYPNTVPIWPTSQKR